MFSNKPNLENKFKLGGEEIDKEGSRGKFLLGMCRWPLRAPTPLYSILWPIIDPISVTFGPKRNFRVPNLVTFYFYELTHFLD